MEKDKQKQKPYNIGGQAVMEGVMMRGKDVYSLAVRNPKTGIQTVVRGVGKKTPKFFKLPIVRGVYAFIQSLTSGIKVIYDSAEMSGLTDLEEEEPSKFDKWLERKFGDKLASFMMTISVIIALVAGVLLFMALPTFLAGLLRKAIGQDWITSIAEGVVRIVIFLLYLILVSKTKEIKRVFGYHGAEHKTINCYENNGELTVESVKAHSRLHKRCGTSFLLIVMLVSMIFFFFVPIDDGWMRVLSRIVFLPVVAGLSYEIIRWAGSNDNAFVRAVSYPGICLQKITTNEPDDEMIEVAITAVKLVLEAENATTTTQSS